MPVGKKHRPVAGFVMGLVCLAFAALNWWNVVRVGVTFWSLLVAVGLTLIGFYWLVRGFRALRIS